MSETFPLTVGSWFSRGWSTYKSKPKQMIGGAVIFSVINLALALAGSIPGGSLVNTIVSPAITAGWLFLCLRLVRGDDVKISNMFDAFSRFGAVWVTFFLYGLIVVGGVILLVIPGIIWALKYGQSLYAVMDKELSAREAIRFSGRITAGHKGKLFGAYFMSFLLGIPAILFSLGLQGSQFLDNNMRIIFVAVGLVPCLVTVLVITPWVSATFAAAYDSLASRGEIVEIEKI